MQLEKAVLFAYAGVVFSALRYEALRTLRERIAVDCFGIDGGFDPDGNLVVFEDKASMAVDDDEVHFTDRDRFGQRHQESLRCNAKKKRRFSSRSLRPRGGAGCTA
jgi:hypothetical protein